MEILHTERALRAAIWRWRGSGETIGFVPTMGALHDGHLSLVRLARRHASKVVASIYVNPTQFAEGEDLDTYPRDLSGDARKLKAAGCDLVFAPRGSLYRDSHATKITVSGAALGLETDFRPHFFDGVALIVTKLLNLVAPDAAVFGEKDYQQLLTIRTLTADLNMPVKIIGAPIIREADGLAMSSRNQYLGPQARARAGKLNVILRQCSAKIRGGAEIEAATDAARKALLDAGFSKIDYVACADEHTLALMSGALKSRRARLLVAAHMPVNGRDDVRLIDNMAV